MNSGTNGGAHSEKTLTRLLPLMVEAGLAERPPIDEVLQSAGISGTGDLKAQLADIEANISTLLATQGLFPCRRIRGLIPHCSSPVWKTLYYRPAEQLLFQAIEDPHPIILANTFEPQRYVDAAIGYCRNSSPPRQLWVWKGAAGRSELSRTDAPGTANARVRVALAPADGPSAEEARNHALNDGFVPSSTVFNGQEIAFLFKLTREDGEENWLGSREPENVITLVIMDQGLDEQERDALAHQCASYVYSYIHDNADKYPDLEHEKKRAESFVQALHLLQALPIHSVAIIPDAHHFLNTDIGVATVGSGLLNIGALKEVYHRLKTLRKDITLVLLSGEVALPKDVREEVLRIDLPLPSRRELYVAIKEALRAANMPNTDDELLVRLSQEGAGMTLAEGQAVLARAIESGHANDPDALIQALRLAKRQHIGRSPALELVDASGVAELGGMERFQGWLANRHKAFSQPEKAKAAGINRPPRGVLLLGIPGSGKSLAAKMIAREWRLPLVRLDLGAIHDRFVGASEARIREALRVVEAMAPCILWIDEIDKGMAQGPGNWSHSADLNIRASLLTWMQENRHPVFIVATANRFDSLPPELTRAGRFDARFFFGCPGKAGRQRILEIHLLTRGFEPTSFDLDVVAHETVGFTGAELEQVVLDALYAAFDRDERLSTEMLAQRVVETKPLIKSVGAGLDQVWELIDQGRVEIASDEMLSRAQVARLIDPYLFRPVYCHLDKIAGFERQAAAAERLLMASPFGGPAAAVMNTGEPNWLYVHTNFSRDPADRGHFKFLDRLSTIELNFVFDTLVSDHALETIYFEAAGLRDLFENSAALSAYAETFKTIGGEGQ